MLLVTCNPMDIVFMLDVAGTVDPRYIAQIQNFVSSVTLQLPVNSGQVRVGAMTFATNQRTEISLDQCSTISCLLGSMTTFQYQGTRYALSSIILRMFSACVLRAYGMIEPRW